MTALAAAPRRATPPTLQSLAGPLLLRGGVMIVISQIAVWPLRRDDLISTLTSPIYIIAMAAYLAGMWMLIIGVLGLHLRQAGEAGTFGLIAVVGTAIGTTNMAGNVWFDTSWGHGWRARFPPRSKWPGTGLWSPAPCSAMSL